MFGPGFQPGEFGAENLEIALRVGACPGFLCSPGNRGHLGPGARFPLGRADGSFLIGEGDGVVSSLPGGTDPLYHHGRGWILVPSQEEGTWLKRRNFRHQLAQEGFGKRSTFHFLILAQQEATSPQGGEGRTDEKPAAGLAHKPIPRKLSIRKFPAILFSSLFGIGY